jgi:hypothetical protein
MSWISDIFRAGQANRGNVVRRSIATVQANGGLAALQAEVQRRGFHMARIGDQYVIVCNANGTIQVIC